MPVATFGVSIGLSGLLGGWNYALWDTGVWDGGGPPMTNITDVWRSDSPLSFYSGLDSFQPAIPPRAGAAQVNIDNVAGTYNPGTSAGLKGQPISISAGYIRTFPLPSLFTTLWGGLIDAPKWHPEIGQQSVDWSCLGPFNSIISQGEGTHKISTALYQNILVSDAMGVVLDAVGWPTALRSIDTSKTTLLWWWCEDADPWTEMQRLLAAEGPTAVLYEDASVAASSSLGSAAIIFRNRDAVNTRTRSNTSQATLSATPGAAIQIARPFNYDDGKKYVVNSGTWSTNVRTAKPIGVVWTGVTPLVLAANQTVTYHATASSSVPFQAAVCTNGVDYTVTVGAATVTLNRTSGQSVAITILAGAAGATITGLQLRAQLVSIDSTTSITNTVNAPLAAGVLEYPLNLPQTPEIDPSLALGLVNGYVSLYKDGRPVVTVTLINVSDAALVQQMSGLILDRVTVVVSGLNVNADFFIYGIGMEVTEGGAFFKVTYTCVLATSFAGWDQSVWDTGVWGI